jgi:hypothetical protein
MQLSIQNNTVKILFFIPSTQSYVVQGIYINLTDYLNSRQISQTWNFCTSQYELLTFHSYKHYKNCEVMSQLIPDNINHC